MSGDASRYLTHGWGAHVSDPFGELRWIDGDGAELILPLDVAARSEPPRGVDGAHAPSRAARAGHASRWSSTAARPFVLRRIQSSRRSSNSRCRREALCSFPVSIGLPSSAAREQRPLRCTASRSSKGRWGRWARPAHLPHRAPCYSSERTGLSAAGFSAPAPILSKSAGIVAMSALVSRPPSSDLRGPASARASAAALGSECDAHRSGP